MNRYQDTHATIRAVFEEALRGVEPRMLVRESLRQEPISLGSGRLLVLAFGKAAATMALGAHDALADRIDAGIVLTKDGHISERIADFEYFEASHPVPDQRGVQATRRILDLVQNLAEEDVVLTLISGGASALLEAPVPGVSLEDVQTTTSMLLNAGAPIQDLNAVRTRLSLVKGGGLLRAIEPAACHSLILSDVLGNDPRVIASGPTITDDQLGNHSEPAGAIVARYGLINTIPEAVRQVLLFAPSLPADETAPETSLRIIGDNELFVGLVEQGFQNRGFSTNVIWRAREGEASSVAAEFVNEARSSQTDVVVGGGETTVTVTGNGKGGRNTEFALAAALELTPADHLVVASLASDGQDGFADAAGAIADAETVTRANTLQLNARDYLRNNDSATIFEQLGNLVHTGPTGTNVNDVYIAMSVK